jgi:hypothetical protein
VAASSGAPESTGGSSAARVLGPVSAGAVLSGAAALPASGLCATGLLAGAVLSAFARSAGALPGALAGAATSPLLLSTAFPRSGALDRISTR